MEPFTDEDGDMIVPPRDVKAKKREYGMLLQKVNKPLDSYATPVGTMPLWWCSEKLEGYKAIWDGGISIGKTDVPWNASRRVCTGLFTRYGNPIHAPKWYIDQLPRGVLLDGELYIPGRYSPITWNGTAFRADPDAVRPGIPERQLLGSIVRSFEPSPDWKKVVYMVCDNPPPVTFFEKGLVRAYGGKVLDYSKAEQYLVHCREQSTKWTIPSRRLDWVARYVEENCLNVRIHNRVPYMFQEFCDTVLSLGGEGVVLHRANRPWVTERSDGVLKFKPHDDGDGVIVAIEGGEGRNSGRMGAIVVKTMGVVINIGTGFTDDMRDDPAQFGIRVGAEITFRYRGLTADKMPSEARYMDVKDA